MTRKTNGLKTKLWRNVTGCCKGTEQVDAVRAGLLSFNFTISPYSRLYADGLAVGLIEVVTACFICLVFSIVPDNDMVRRFALTWTSSTWRISRSSYRLKRIRRHIMTHGVTPRVYGKNRRFRWSVRRRDGAACSLYCVSFSYHAPVFPNLFPAVFWLQSSNYPIYISFQMILTDARDRHFLLIFTFFIFFFAFSFIHFQDNIISTTTFGRPSASSTWSSTSTRENKTHVYIVFKTCLRDLVISNLHAHEMAINLSIHSVIRNLRLRFR